VAPRDRLEQRPEVGGRLARRRSGARCGHGSSVRPPRHVGRHTTCCRSHAFSTTTERSPRPPAGPRPRVRPGVRYPGYTIVRALPTAGGRPGRPSRRCRRIWRNRGYAVASDGY
jgi:hypothetical protein